MKALCQEYRNGARRNEQRNGENDTYRFQRRHNGQRDHAQQPIMQPSRMQTAYLRLLIIKAEQQKIPPFYANNKCNQPGNNHRLDYIADGYPEHVAEKNMAAGYGGSGRLSVRLLQTPSAVKAFLFVVNGRLVGVRGTHQPSAHASGSQANLRPTALRKSRMSLSETGLMIHA